MDGWFFIAIIVIVLLLSSFFVSTYAMAKARKPRQVENAFTGKNMFFLGIRFLCYNL